MAIEDDAIEQHPRKRSNPNLPEQLPNIPPEIITDILSRLPVKSLLRFRSVSKSWRSMISNPKFVKKQLTVCSNDRDFAHHKIIYISDPYKIFYAIEACHISPVLNGFSVNPVALDYPMKNSGFSVCIVGSINGLICIAVGEKYLFLWNPATRISKKLPDSGIKMVPEDRIRYAFGYDESTDDYKVVAIARKRHKYMCGTRVMVYSSRLGLWRRIGDFPSDIYFIDPGMYVNGAIHWAAIKITGSDLVYWVIVSLDLANETYSEIAPPKYDKGEGGLMMTSLAVLGECLCVPFHCYGKHSDIWMMKDYGVRESWIKLTTIRYTKGIDIHKYPVPLYISKNGEILMEFNSRIIMYDPQSQSFRNLNICHVNFSGKANTYFESLVSPLIQEVLERQP